MIQKKILFISHDDSRTGAPLLLLNLSRAIITSSPNYKIDFLIKYSFNETQNLFQEQGKTFVLDYQKNDYGIIRRIYHKLFPGRIQKNRKNKIKGLNLNSYDLILSNTLTNGDILPIIRRYYKGIIVSYIHELIMASNYFTSQELIKKMITSSDFFLYPSFAVRDFLRNNFLIEEGKLHFLPYYIPSEEIDKVNSAQEDLMNTFVIGACGTTDWRKGFDIFIQLVVYMKEKHHGLNLKFIWKGAMSNVNYDRAIYDIEKSGIKDMLEIKMSDNNMIEFWKSIDLFILTSREDPFPLVVLEAARLKIPTVAFNGSGGVAEFISDDAGILVPYLSISSMAESIADCYRNRQKIENFGAVSLEKMNCLYSNSHEVFRQFQNVIKRNEEEPN